MQRNSTYSGGARKVNRQTREVGHRMGCELSIIVRVHTDNVLLMVSIKKMVLVKEENLPGQRLVVACTLSDKFLLLAWL